MKQCGERKEGVEEEVQKVERSSAQFLEIRGKKRETGEVKKMIGLKKLFSTSGASFLAFKKKRKMRTNSPGVKNAW